VGTSVSGNGELVVEQIGARYHSGVGRIFCAATLSAKPPRREYEPYKSWNQKSECRRLGRRNRSEQERVEPTIRFKEETVRHDLAGIVNIKGLS